MKRLACAFAVVSLALAGCSSSLCDDLADTGKDLYEKTKACPSWNDGTPYTEPTEAEFKKCEADVAKCSDDDHKTIRSFNSCVRDLPQCTTSTESQFDTAFEGCAKTHLVSVSETCRNSISGESLRHAARVLQSR